MKSFRHNTRYSGLIGVPLRTSVSPFGPVANVMKWIEKVRTESTKFIASLDEDDFHKVPPTADGLSIGHWIFITVGHGALHIGKIQMLRNMLQSKRDNPC